MFTSHLVSIITLYNSGLSSLEVARILNVSKRLVLLRLKKSGTTRRSLAEALRTYVIKDDYFNIIDTEHKAYWLGFMLADANIGEHGRYGKSKALRCTLQRRDRQHLVRFLKDIGTDKPIQDITAINRKSGKGYPASFVRITCTRLCDDLLRHGWHEFKENGDVAILNTVDKELRYHLIRGLVDGDGWIVKRKYGIGFCDLHKSIVQWVRQHIDNSRPPLFRTKRNKCYRVIFTGKNRVQAIINRLYLDCQIALARKLSLATLVMQNRLAIS
jgi:hypothetical protein